MIYFEIYLFFFQANTQYQLRVQRVQDRLEACVDPFDLDVFSPYLQSHLTRQVHRASVSANYFLYIIIPFVV